jgi:hypothetical protein
MSRLEFGLSGVTTAGCRMLGRWGTGGDAVRQWERRLSHGWVPDGGRC